MHTFSFGDRKKWRRKKYKGIITSKPIHFLKPSEEGCDLDIENLAVDVGACSKQEVMEVVGIRPGDPIVPDVTFEYNEETEVCFGKAFDNRLGCTCIIETMKALAEESNLAVDVVGGFATQEEKRNATIRMATEVIRGLNEEQINKILRKDIFCQ